MKIAILGFQREGQSLLRFFHHSPSYRGAEFWILDRNPKIRKRIPGIHWQLGEQYLKDLDQFDLIFRSPGIPYLTPAIQSARRQGVTILSATKLFFSLISQGSVPKPIVIGITGTKGKGTTATLLYQILRRAKKRVVLAGNIGIPMLDALTRASRADYVILELSSFQLQDLDQSPDIAVILDVFADHLDHHASTREYYAAKRNICAHQMPSNAVFFFTNNANSHAIARTSSGKKIGVTPTTDSVKKNYEMATAVARHLGVAEQAINKTITKFKGLEHRLELVRHITPAKRFNNVPPSRTAPDKRGKKLKISFINDSAATNPIATVAAIRSLSQPVILIAGGKDKGLDFTPLIRALRQSSVHAVVLIGENKSKLARAFKSKKYKVEKSKNLQSAITAAYRIAQSLVASHLSPVTILFSPAAASFDMFKSYADRGKQFKKIVQSIRG